MVECKIDFFEVVRKKRVFRNGSMQISNDPPVNLAEDLSKASLLTSGSASEAGE